MEKPSRAWLSKLRAKAFFMWNFGLAGHVDRGVHGWDDAWRAVPANATACPLPTARLKSTDASKLAKRSGGG